MIYWKVYAVIFCLTAVGLGLTCPSLYDYSAGSVQCVASCPAGTTQIESSCCTINQYYADGGCRICNGWVLKGGLSCCRYGMISLMKA